MSIDEPKIVGKLQGESIPRGGPPGYPDAIADIRVESDFDGTIYGFVIFGIKPKLDSFGAVLRQLRHYESLMGPKRNKLVLITPDEKWDGRFELEGVTVVHSPPC